VRRAVATTILLLGFTISASLQQLTLPMKEGSTRFAVIGDSGTGGGAQKKVADQIVAVRKMYPFEFVLMMGDNLYGGEGANDYRKKFEEPYKALLDAGIKFYAVLGNHDDPNQRFYKLFNMNGERYYTFKGPKPGVRFFGLDSNYMSKEQLVWLEKELAASGSDWKIAFFHHPLYSSGDTHGSDETLREQLEPLFVKYGVDAVFTGHEHFYERIKPQKGIAYFISGSSAKLRRGNINRTDLTAKGFDTGYSFMILEIAGDEMYFQANDENGKTIDSGVVKRREKKTSRNNSIVGYRLPLQCGTIPTAKRCGRLVSRLQEFEQCRGRIVGLANDVVRQDELAEVLTVKRSLRADRGAGKPRRFGICVRVERRVIDRWRSGPETTAADLV
jgi:predicted phosphodiesterase